VSDHVVVLDYGRRRAEGEPRAGCRDPRGLEAKRGSEAWSR
jgi:hypothetical protein